MTVTSIQLVAAYGALANDGVLLQPTLVRRVRGADGRVIREHEPRVVRRVVTTEVAHEITRVLAGVVRSGTGDEAALQTIDIAGKTGTSRISADGAYQAGRYVASFVGYLPADDPQLVVLAKLSDPKSSIYGGGAAAPVSRAVVQAILSAADSGLVTGRVVSTSGSPDDWDHAFTTDPVDPTPFRFAAANADPDGGATATAIETAAASLTADGEQNPAGTVVLPDLRGLGLREAVARLHTLGLAVDNEAGGRVEATSPGPGAHVVPGARVLLH
jgi:cell division protein FtsI (penicillin-binding protein 3)